MSFFSGTDSLKNGREQTSIRDPRCFRCFCSSQKRTFSLLMSACWWCAGLSAMKTEKLKYTEKKMQNHLRDHIRVLVDACYTTMFKRVQNNNLEPKMPTSMILKTAGYDPPTLHSPRRMDADSDGRISLKELENVPGKQTWKISWKGCLSWIYGWAFGVQQHFRPTPIRVVVFSHHRYHRFVEGAESFLVGKMVEFFFESPFF